MKRFQLFITILVSVFIFTSLVYAQPCSQKGIKGMGMGAGMCAPWLNLTAEQQTQVTELHNTFNKETTMLQNKVYKKRLKMKSLLLEDKIDTEKVFNLQKKISELTAKIDIQALKSMLKGYSVLTAEQRAQLPPGCSLGFGVTNCSKRPCMSGRQGMGPGCNMRMGRGRGQYQ
jgi:Spy/CpxP family protein refolding chaperone